ncbi:8905_t:CDS:2 [Funneliformis mosseae]|uniref:8905_t:CDS:1 n=1 Tax=Funneliformis mosseae TaxID=27381 RepID=A0A9N9F3U1_FUNMO|nr:8905_t:CDS:2 [Funneliformis mosseae]
MDNFWDEDTNNTKRQRSNPIPVVIKVVNGFDSETFINELKFQHQFMTSGRRFLRLYGVTQKTDTKEYVIFQRWRQNPPHYILDQFENSKYHTENNNDANEDSISQIIYISRPLS